MVSTTLHWFGLVGDDDDDLSADIGIAIYRRVCFVCAVKQIVLTKKKSYVVDVFNVVK